MISTKLDGISVAFYSTGKCSLCLGAWANSTKFNGFLDQINLTLAKNWLNYQEKASFSLIPTKSVEPIFESAGPISHYTALEGELITISHMTVQDSPFLHSTPGSFVFINNYTVICSNPWLGVVWGRGLIIQNHMCLITFEMDP